MSNPKVIEILSSSDNEVSDLEVDTINTKPATTNVARRVSSSPTNNNKVHRKGTTFKTKAASTAATTTTNVARRVSSSPTHPIAANPNHGAPNATRGASLATTHEFLDPKLKLALEAKKNESRLRMKSKGVDIDASNPTITLACAKCYGKYERDRFVAPTFRVSKDCVVAAGRILLPDCGNTQCTGGMLRPLEYLDHDRIPKNNVYYSAKKFHKAVPDSTEYKRDRKLRQEAKNEMRQELKKCMSQAGQGGSNKRQRHH